MNDASLEQQTSQPQPSEILSSHVLTDNKNRRSRFKQQPAWLPLSDTELADIVMRFENTEVTYGEDSRGVFADISVAEHRLRLHALVWTEDTLLTSNMDSGLSLLLVLSPINNGYLPIDTV